jgi:WD40 repeat protein
VGNSPEPYVGPRPFHRDDEHIFFGREREANELLSLIIAHPVVLIYAQSGAGKTSLLNAKVTPLLEERHSEVFGLARVSGELPQDIKSADVMNIYVFNTLLSLQRDSPDPGAITRLTLTEFFKSRPHVPRVDGISSRRIIIFDQFEEIFTTSPDRWHDRTDFFDNVGAALEADTRLRVVFAMREEYIASMDPFAITLPEKLRTRFRLERLREEAALQAVKRPLADTGRRFAPGAAEKLVKNLLRVPIKSTTGTIDISGEYVEPVQLQVVCQKLWQSLPLNVEIIDDTYIENYGDVDKALSTYYEDCIRHVAADKRGKEGELRRWFGKILITSDGTRGTVYKDVKTTGGLPNNIVEMLENMRLVRTELRGGAPWYELTHDRFIGPILRSNQDWFNEHEKGVVISQKLEARSEEWALTRSEKSNYGLLTGPELAEAKEWLESPDAEEIGVSNTLREFVQTSNAEAERERAEKQSRIAKGLRQQRAFLAIILIIAVSLAIFAVYSQIQESRARKQADNAKLIERGKLAEALSNRRGNEFDGLVLGLKAIDVRSGDGPPVEAIQGLRKAIAVVGNTIWLRRVSTPVEKVEFSLDGGRVLTSSKDKVCVSESITGELIFTKEITPGASWKSVGLSPNGKTVFTIEALSQGQPRQAGEGQDKSDQSVPIEKNKYVTRIWDIQTQKLLEIYPTGLSDTDMLIFSKNGGRILTYSSDNKLRVFDANTGKLIVTIPVLEIDIGQLRFSPQGTRIVTVTKRGVAELWNVLTGKRITQLLQVDPGSYVLQEFSNDDSHILVGKYAFSGNPSASIWNAKDGKKLLTLRVSESSLRAGIISSDERRIILYTGSYDSPIIKALIYDESTGNLLEEKALGTTDFINYHAFFSLSKDGLVGIENPYIKDPRLRYYLTRYRESRNGENKTSVIFLWKFFSEEKHNLITGYPTRFRYVSAAPNLERIATISEDEMVQIWEVNNTPHDTNSLSVSQLRGLACDQLRYQDEFKEVVGLCR